MFSSEHSYFVNSIKTLVTQDKSNEDALDTFAYMKNRRSHGLSMLHMS